MYFVRGRYLLLAYFRCGISLFIRLVQPFICLFVRFYLTLVSAVDWFSQGCWCVLQSFVCFVWVKCKFDICCFAGQMFAAANPSNDPFNDAVIKLSRQLRCTLLTMLDWNTWLRLFRRLAFRYATADQMRMHRIIQLDVIQLHQITFSNQLALVAVDCALMKGFDHENFTLNWLGCTLWTYNTCGNQKFASL